MQRLLRTLLAAAALVLAPMAASAQTALYPGTLFTWTDPVGLCNPPSVTSGCISKSMVSQGLEEVQALEATLGTNLTGLNNRKYTLLSTADRTRLGVDINQSTPATSSVNIGDFLADPSSVSNGDIWVRRNGTVKFRANGTTYTLVSTPPVFTSLTDVPSSYFGQSLKVVRVNAGETGLEFGAAGVGTHNLLSASHPDTLAASPVLGALVAGNATPAWQRVAGNTSATRKFWLSQGNGTISALPFLDVLLAADIPNLPASIITSGQISPLRGGLGLDASASNGFPKATSGSFSIAALVAGDIPNLDASKITTGTVATARLGSGTADATTFLRGDQTWQTPSGSGDITDVWGCTSGNCNALTAASGDTLDASSADTTKACKSGSSLPGTCSVSECFFKTGVTAGQNQYGCTATNTWTLEGDGGGGGSPHDLLDGSIDQDTLAGTVVLGDVIAGNSTPKWSRVAGNTSATKKYLQQTGNGSVSALPVWAIIAAADLPVMIASGGSHAPGAVPDPPGSSGSTKFLREDATWAVPAGGGGNPVWNVLTKTASYTVVSGDITGQGVLVICSTGSGSVPLILPAANAVAGGVVAVKREGANACTVTRASTDTIYDTAAVTVKTLTSDGQFFEFVADGTSSWVLK